MSTTNMSQHNVVNERQLRHEVSLPQEMNKLYHGVEMTCGTFVVSYKGTSEDKWQYTVEKENS